jgi:hypothetical protein
VLDSPASGGRAPRPDVRPRPLDPRPLHARRDDRQRRLRGPHADARPDRPQRRGARPAAPRRHPDDRRAPRPREARRLAPTGRSRRRALRWPAALRDETGDLVRERYPTHPAAGVGLPPRPAAARRPPRRREGAGRDRGHLRGGAGRDRASGAAPAGQASRSCSATTTSSPRRGTCPGCWPTTPRARGRRPPARRRRRPARPAHAPGGLDLLPPGRGWLLVELAGDDAAEARSRAEALLRDLGARGTHDRVVVEPADQAAVWRVRAEGLGAITVAPGHPPKLSGWEDAAVAPDRLGDYLADLVELVDRARARGRDLRPLRGRLRAHQDRLRPHHRGRAGDLPVASSRRPPSWWSPTAACRPASTATVRPAPSSTSGSSGPSSSTAFRRFKALWDPEGAA